MELEVFEPDKTTPAAGVELDQVDAVMPAHKHGMKVAPGVEKVGPGKFRLEGMRFHMRGSGDDGRWVLQALLRQGEQVDQTEIPFQCCRL